MSDDLRPVETRFRVAVPGLGEPGLGEPGLLFLRYRELLFVFPVTGPFVVNRRIWMQRVVHSVGVAGLAGFSRLSQSVAGDEASSDVQVSDRGTPTLGGMQFWADRSWLQGWKIQQHVYTHHCRLLDPLNGRHYTGSLLNCERALQQVRESKQLHPDTGRAVVLIHGIIRSSKSMQIMAEHLKSTHDVVIGFEYPSTRVPIDESAEYLHLLLESLTNVESIDLIGHSMGGLIVRSYLSSHRDPRLHRMVMLGTPNRGAELADLFRRNVLYRWVMGPAGQELGTNADSIISALPVPDFEFGVIAGGNGSNGYNPLLPGDDDGTVTVNSARLPGAADFLRVPCLHSFLIRNEAAVQAAGNFLQNGRFRTEADAVPIPADDGTNAEPPRSPVSR